MTTISTLGAHRARWTLLRAESTIGVLTPGHAIDDYFVAHPEIGSPIGPEQDWSDRPNGKIRAFSAGTVGWSPGNGVEVNPQP